MSGGGGVDETPTLVEGRAPSSNEPITRAPQKIGRFTVLEELGEGGMGVVYAAYDLDLDRKIAVKVLRQAARGRRDSDEARQRLLREAQAMARLSHPNVATVYEVGTVGRDVFLAIEFIAGQTLAAWVEDRGRALGWRAIVEVFRSAGRGLAAAHRAGLVHRDFKPANVLVDAEDRPRVLDFGLASLDPGRASGESRSSSSGRGLDVSLTAEGVVMGTPAYMAPEQFLGAAVDARCDQYAFCVSLYECLAGRRPYRGRSFDELRAEVLAGRPPAGDLGAAPAWLARAVLRGLGREPSDRWPSMDALIDALGRDPSRRRRVLALGMFGVVALGGLAASLRAAIVDRDAAVVDPCDRAAARLVGVWDEERQAQVNAAFTATAVSYAADTFARVRERYATWATRWESTHREVCRATRVEGVQPPELMNARFACLDRRLSEARALATVLAAADPAVIESAADAAARLRDPAACRDVEGTEIEVPLPRDPDQAARVIALRQRLDDAAAAEEAQRFEEATTIAGEVAREAETLGYLPLLAEARLRLARGASHHGAFEDANAFAEQALWAAEVGRHDAAAVDVWTFLLYNVGYSAGQRERAELLAPRMDAALARLGPDPDREAEVLKTHGTLAFQAHDWDRAIARYGAALTILEREHGSAHVATAALDQNLGTALYRAGRLDDSSRHLERALATYVGVRGESHPGLTAVHTALGGLRRRQRDLPAAEHHYQLALDLHLGGHGPGGLGEVLCRRNLGLVQADRGDHEAAVATFRRALEIEIALHGAERPPLMTSAELGASLLALGRLDEAIAHLEPVVVDPKMHAREPGRYATAAFELAQAQWQTDRRARPRALELVEDARARVVAGARRPPLAAIDAWLVSIGHPELAR